MSIRIWWIAQCDRHEVGQLRYTLDAEQTRQQDVGIGQIELLVAWRLQFGIYPKTAALLLIE